jgi:FkbM family methyltransferase
MRPELVAGEGYRWYLRSARHPFKSYLVGHYWALFCKPRVRIRYDGDLGIKVCLADYVQRAIFFDGYYERTLIEWLKKTLTAEDVFWDVGANVGAIALVAARRCHRVVAFEPDPRSLEQLRENVRFNRLSNVEIVAAALGAQTGSATLYQAAESNTGMSSILKGRAAGAQGIAVRALRADDFLASNAGAFPNILKMDVEGAEHLVAQGGGAMLRDGRLRALVFEDRRASGGGPRNRELLAALQEAGFVIGPLGASDAQAEDAMHNFLATRQ